MIQKQDEIKEWIARMPKIYRAAFRKAMKGKSLRAAINAKCQDCCNWQREEIKNCAIETCSLWYFRPYSGSKVPQDEGV